MGRASAPEKRSQAESPVTPIPQGEGGPGAGVSAARKQASKQASIPAVSCPGLLQPPPTCLSSSRGGLLLGQAKTALPKIAPATHRLRHRARAFFRQAAPSPTLFKHSFKPGLVRIH